MANVGRPTVLLPDQVVEILEETDKPFLTTSEVAEHTEYHANTVRKRLQTAEEEGRIRKRELGGNTPAWYLPEIENPQPIEDTEDAFERALDEDEDLRAAVDKIREVDETDAEVVLRLLNRAIDARDADALDKIGAERELRDAVEAVREEGEPLEDAVRRFVRSGVEAEREDTLAEVAYRRADDMRPYILGFGIPTIGFSVLLAIVAAFPSLGEVPVPFYADLSVLLSSLTAVGSVATFLFCFIYLSEIFSAYVADRQGWESSEDIPLLGVLSRKFGGAASS